MARPGVHRLRQGSSPSRALRANRVGSVRGGAAQAGSLSRSLRWVPCAASLRVEDVPGAVRQQQILGERERGRSSGRGPRLCRARRSAPGWPYRRRASPKYGRGEIAYDPWHYVPVLARKPGALRNGAPFKDWVLPAALERVRRRLAGTDDGDRQMVAILSAVLTASRRLAKVALIAPKRTRHCSGGLIHALRMQAKRGRIVIAGKEKGAIVCRVQ